MPPPRHLPALLSAIAALALAVLAAVTWLTLSIQLEEQDRRQVQQRLELARKLLVRVDGAGSLADLPLHFQAAFAADPRLAVLVQGAYGQVLYQQGASPQVLAAAAPGGVHGPVPLATWRDGRHLWRGSAVPMQTQLSGAAPLSVVMAVETSAQDAFLTSLGLTLAAYVLLATLACGIAFTLVLRRASAPPPAAAPPRTEPPLD